jgi:hypothetical protein
MMLTFEWDAEKARENLKKHDASFEEAKTVFDDLFSITIADPEHSTDEERYIDIGLSAKGQILVVVYTERGSDIRIISCRKATTVERRTYDQEKSEPNELDSLDDTMLPEYDFSRGARGKHYQAYREGHTVKIYESDGTVTIQNFTLEEGTVLLEPDVREYFRDSEAVNRALRGLIALIPRKQQVIEAKAE